VLSGEDPALQLLTLKSHLKDDINRIMKHYERHKKGCVYIKDLITVFISDTNLIKCISEFNVIHKKSIKWKRGSNGYNANVPRYIADIAELLDMDPDPYFEGVCLTHCIHYCCKI